MIFKGMHGISARSRGIERTRPALTPTAAWPQIATMYFYGLAGDPSDFDPLALLLAALLLDAVIGEAVLLFRRVPHPVAAIGRLVAFLERKLNRDQRSAADRMWRGAFTVLLVTGLCVAVGWGIAWSSRQHMAGQVVELLLLTFLIAQRSLFDHVRAVGVALRSDGLIAARRAVAHIVGRDPHKLDRHAVARAAIESCAENFSDGVVAPVFWYVLFGLPGILAYKAVNTMDSMIGHLSPRYRAFGMVAARLDDVMNLIPARLAALLIALAALFLPGGKPGAAVATVWRDARRHRSPNAGWPEAAMAGALGLALAGPRQYADGPVMDAWMGRGRPQATPEDIRRSLYILAIACLIITLAVAATIAAQIQAGS